MEIIFSSFINFIGTIIIIYCIGDAIEGIVKVYKKKEDK